MANDYTINGSAVNTRQDWRAVIVPGGLSRQDYESFPGDPGVYVIKDQVLPETLVITGFLEAEDRAGLDAAMRGWFAALASLQTKTVVINGSTYEDMDLADVRPLGPVQGMRRGATQLVRVPVRFTWRRLIHA